MNEQATQKQLDYIDCICQLLRLDKPKNLTKKSASDFIKEHKDEYHFECELYGFENEFLNG